MTFHLLWSRRSCGTLLPTTLGVVAAALITIRSDGIIPVAIAFLAALWVWRGSVRMIVIAATAFSIYIIAFNGVAPALIGRVSNLFGYELTLKLNPLGYILQNEFYSPSPEQDLAAIDKVVSVEALKTIQKPYETASYWSGNAVRWQSTETERSVFREVYRRLVRDNIPLFVAGRAITFGVATGLTPGAQTVHDEYIYEWDNLDRTYNSDSRPFDFEPFFPEARKRWVAWLRDTARFEGWKPKGSVLYWNVLPELALLVLLALAYRFCP